MFFVSYLEDFWLESLAKLKIFSKNLWISQISRICKTQNQEHKKKTLHRKSNESHIYSKRFKSNDMICCNCLASKMFASKKNDKGRKKRTQTISTDIDNSEQFRNQIKCKLSKLSTKETLKIYFIASFQPSPKNNFPHIHVKRVIHIPFRIFG